MPTLRRRHLEPRNVASVASDKRCSISGPKLSFRAAVLEFLEPTGGYLVRTQAASPNSSADMFQLRFTFNYTVQFGRLFLKIRVPPL